MDTRLEAMAKAKDSLFEDRPFRGQGQECRGQGQGPRTQLQVFSKKKSSKKFFRQSPIHRRG